MITFVSTSTDAPGLTSSFTARLHAQHRVQPTVPGNLSTATSSNPAARRADTKPCRSAIPRTSVKGFENTVGALDSAAIPPLFRTDDSGISRALAADNSPNVTSRHLNADDVTPSFDATSFSRATKVSGPKLLHEPNGVTTVDGISNAAAKLLASCSTRSPPVSTASQVRTWNSSCARSKWRLPAISRRAINTASSAYGASLTTANSCP